MQAVATAEEASKEVESILGLWTHIVRVARTGGEHVVTSTSLYQKDLLQF
jgi:hypothetical protein